MRDALDQQGVVVGELAPSGRDCPVQPYPGASRRAVRLDPTAVRPEVVLRVLGCHPPLDGKAVAPHGLLALDTDVREGAPRCDQNLALHDVHARDLLSDGVLDLNPRVHLQEVVLSVRGEHELDRASVDVSDVLGDLLGILVHRQPCLLLDSDARGDFDDLLVPPLHRAVPLVQVHGVAVRVRQDLNLDVAWVLNVLFQEHPAVAKGLQRLVARPLVRRLELGLGPDDPEAPAPAPHGRLDHDGKPDVLGVRVGGVHVQPLLLGPRDDRDAALDGNLPGLGLVPEPVQILRRRADEDNSLLLAPPRKVGVLAEEAVTRVDGLHVVLLGDLDDRLDVQVRAHRAQLPVVRVQEVGLVRLVAVDLQTVLVAEDGNGANAELVRGAKDAGRDLAAVRAKQLLDGGLAAVHGRGRVLAIVLHHLAGGGELPYRPRHHRGARGARGPGLGPQAPRGLRVARRRAGRPEGRSPHRADPPLDGAQPHPGLLCCLKRLPDRTRSAGCLWGRSLVRRGFVWVGSRARSRARSRAKDLLAPSSKCLATLRLITREGSSSLVPPLSLYPDEETADSGIQFEISITKSEILVVVLQITRKLRLIVFPES